MWICVHFHALLLWIYVDFFYLRSDVTKLLQSTGCRVGGRDSWYMVVFPLWHLCVCVLFFFLTKFRNLSVSTLVFFSSASAVTSYVSVQRSWVVPYVVVCWLYPFSLLLFALALYLKCFSISLRVKTQCFRQVIFICKSQMPSNPCLMKTQLITVWLLMMMMMILVLPLKSCPWTAHCLSGLSSSNRSCVSLTGLRRAYISKYFSNVDKTQLQNDVTWQKKVFTPLVSLLSQVILGSMAVDVPNFGRFIFTATVMASWSPSPSSLLGGRDLGAFLRSFKCNIAVIKKKQKNSLIILKNISVSFSIYTCCACCVALGVCHVTCRGKICLLLGMPEIPSWAFFFFLPDYCHSWQVVH